MKVMDKTYWAYDFGCDLPMQDIRAAFNAAGPWQWEQRERIHYGDYLSSRPTEGVWLKVHAYPGDYGSVVGLGDKGFKAQLEMPVDSTAQAEIDGIFRRLLQAINATSVTRIERYD
jgi:hypothetical protein